MSGQKYHIKNGINQPLKIKLQAKQITFESQKEMKGYLGIDILMHLPKKHSSSYTVNNLNP